MSIASEITRLQGAKASLKTSIEAKGVTVPAATTLDGYPALVDQIQQGGGGVVEEKNVNFYDYDGELVYSYSKADFLALTEMPANPTHEGFTAQGWNWTLSDAKTYVTSYDYLNIGQHYVTSDGKTRVYVHLDDPDYLFCQASWDQSAANGVSIDWGDGSATETVAGTGQKQLFHAYQTTGDYIIEYTVLSGTVRFGGNGDAYRIFGPAVTTNDAGFKIEGSITKIEIGNCNGFHSQCFKHMTALETVNIPSTAGTWDTPCDGIFDSCYMLKCVIIPNGVTYIGNSAFGACYSMKAVCIPNTVTQTRGGSFRFMYDITTLTLPPNVIIRSTHGIADNYNLKRIIAPNIKIYGSGGTLTFSSNYSAELLPLLTVNNESPVINLVASTYLGCYSLKNFIIPSTITTIGTAVFQNCRSLKEITIPQTVTSIGTAVFQNCRNLQKVIIEPTTPPSLAHSNAFGNIREDCKIIVSFTVFETYRSATNWSSLKQYLVGYLDTEPTQVDYISSDGTAYINTLVPMSDIGKVQVEYRFQGTATGTGKGVVDGAYNQDGKYANIGRDQINTNLIARWGGAAVSFGANDGGWHIFEIDVMGKTAKLDNNSSVSLDVGIFKVYTGYCIFRPYNAPGNYYTETSDRRFVKIWDVHGNLVRDMIPVKIDGVAYMYDRVDKLVFGNAATTGTLSYTDF